MKQDNRKFATSTRIVLHYYGPLSAVGTLLFSGLGLFYLQSYANFEGTNFLLINQNVALLILLCGLISTSIPLIFSYLFTLPLAIRKSFLKYDCAEKASCADNNGTSIIKSLFFYIKLSLPSIIMFYIGIIYVVMICDVEFCHVFTQIFILPIIVIPLLVCVFCKIFNIVMLDYIGIVIFNYINYIILFVSSSGIIFIAYQNYHDDRYYIVISFIMLYVLLINFMVLSAKIRVCFVFILLMIPLTFFMINFSNSALIGGNMMILFNIGGRIPVKVFLKNGIVKPYCLIVDRGNSVTVADISDDAPCNKVNFHKYNETITIPMSEIQSIVRVIKEKNETVKETP